MRNIILALRWVIIAGMIALMAGCATTDLFNGGAGNVMRPGAAEITVISEPSDAEIYLNDKYVGRTPSAKLAFSYQFMSWKQPLGLGYNGAQMAGSYAVKVSKNGYKDAIETIQFDCQSTTCTASCSPKKTKYHFVLEPNPQPVQGSFSNEISKAAEIGKYKELLDKGAITKEEFEQKKKRLLGL